MKCIIKATQFKEKYMVFVSLLCFLHCWLVLLGTGFISVGLYILCMLLISSVSIYLKQRNNKTSWVIIIQQLQTGVHL